MAFQKKQWQFNDIITEVELNRMEEGIEEGVTKAEQAQQTAQQAEQTAQQAQQTSQQTQQALAAHLNDNMRHATQEEKDAWNTHINNKNNPHNVTKEQVGLGNVDNVKQMPISGGTFTGIATAHSNTSYTTRQIRNIILSTADPNVSAMQDGDIWIKYR